MGPLVHRSQAVYFRLLVRAFSNPCVKKAGDGGAAPPLRGNVILFSSPIPARAAWRLSWAVMTFHRPLEVGVAQRLRRSHERAAGKARACHRWTAVICLGDRSSGTRIRQCTVK